jgi:glycine betaine catabolism B
MIIFQTEVVDIIDRAPGVKSFRFNTSGDLAFQPGQFFFVSIMINGQEATKHFSFSNSPTEKGYIEFTKRLTGSEFSKALGRLKKGDWAKIKAPMGNFTFQQEHTRIAFLSGGIGITPIRSICRFVSDKGIASDIVLLYGNSSKKDIIFKEDLDAMSESNKNLKIVYTLTAHDTDDNTWQGRRGFIDKEMIIEEIPDYTGRVFYICGPPNMVAVLSNTLSRGLNIEKDNIIIENFTGY